MTSKKLSNYLAASVCAAAIGLTSPAMAQETHQWSNYHWDNTGTGLALDVRYNFANPVWADYIGDAYVKWRNVITAGVSLAYTYDSSIDTGRCRPIAGAIVICSDSYGFKRGGWLGITTAWADDAGHFQQVTVQYNDTFYNSTYNDPLEREFVTCHEQGHSIGLGHRDEDFYNLNIGSCMDYTADVDGGAQGPSNLNPDGVDAAVLNSDAMYGSGHSLFNHGGGGTSGGSGGPPPGKGPNKFGDLFPEWGTIVGYDGLGRPNQFIQNVAPGLTKVTHVTWSREARPDGMR